MSDNNKSSSLLTSKQASETPHKHIRVVNINLLISILCISFLSNLVLGFFALKNLGPNYKKERQKYSYLAPRIFMENQNDFIVNFNPLRYNLRNYVSRTKDVVSIYFEYLPTGSSIGVREKEEFPLASLAKVPIIIAAYKQIENKQLKFSDVITLTKEDINDGFGDLWKKGPGAQLTVEEAIRLSLIHSDNTAMQALLNRLPKDAYYEVIETLDVQIPTENEYPILSAKAYSSFLRSLYLATYLSKGNSNQILHILTETNGNDRIVAGLPNGTVVAHKEGDFNLGDGSATVYSDCGIIFIPSRPYLLCVMVKAEEAKARNHIANVSRLVHTYITKVEH